MIALALALALAALPVPPCRGDGHNAHRSRMAIAAFKRAHPCPATGKRAGPCPGYVIDHICPLECCGADDPSNMQWQTRAASKAKDRWEGNCAKSCKPHRRAKPATPHRR